MKSGSLKKFQIVTAASMGADVTSAVTGIQYVDNIGIQANYTGTPTGTLKVQVSIDYDQDSQGNVINAGTWTTATSQALAGTADTTYFDMNQLSAPWVRLVYTRTSSTGTLDAFIAAKGI